MSYRKPPGRVEDYTNAFLTMLGVIFFMGFWVIAAIWGFIAVVAVATGLDYLFRSLPRRG